MRWCNLDDLEKAAIYRLHAEFCKTLADANRLLIINELGKGELTVGELTARLGLNQSNVSKHLAVMRQHGMVKRRRDGSNSYYDLSDRRISEAIGLLKEIQAEQLQKRVSLAQLI
ncbi:MAG: helix-turn-helix transcriptional regulator [Chloroflexi bacterium]|jgi:DNA-binding transcriptional ArsR family regulator|nr:helix-turn-helix transcriptional regulator [Chloroflexota bacterium]MBT7080886.1 helix-turn-helix transcriptional regulator [Chloroflexota bacterium]MBT7290784.1 helix-turn-helix transcriptional regulator [Chloroflexota bacterium]